MQKYEPKDIEKKWQKRWEEAKIGQIENGQTGEKAFLLVMFPYPSGAGLHVGHVESYAGTDILARMLRMQGKKVLQPIGWDAFGLPAENFAIKSGIHPAITTADNIATFKRQIKSLGLSYDWEREVNTTDPAYYKWTQWIFIQLFKHGLAYEAQAPINWCPKDKTGLANEEVIGGKCERCGTAVEKKNIRQWLVKITDEKYIERLQNDLDRLDWPESIKTLQKNWIGRSEGAEVVFDLKGIPGQVDGSHTVSVFTTRPDTLFGATFLVVSPELAKKWMTVGWQASDEVRSYVDRAINEREQDRLNADREKTGVAAGIMAMNPATGEDIPVWIADYVIGGYGTGAIMAVPAHDDRDFAFAQKYNLPIKEVVIPTVIDSHDPPRDDKKTVTRKSIQAIVVDPKTKKVLCLKWKKFPWITFISGGIDEGEDMVAAAAREVTEETGYKNLKYIRTLGGAVDSNYFANHKDENRKAIFHALVFELENDERNAVSDEESAAYEAEWMSWEELAAEKRIKCSEYHLWVDRFFNAPHAWTEPGIAVNSGFLNGLPTWKAKDDMTSWLTEHGKGKKVVTYHLRDWLFSRQRYWGEPIPIVHCARCGNVAVPESELPLKLPEVEKYEPTGTGESPLAAVADWVNTTCPQCKGDAKRETNTMPQWAGSNWYFLRYTDPNNDSALASKEALKEWMPVDTYVGGAEHAVLHLLYARFIYKFLFDIGAVPKECGDEPFIKLRNQGMILGEDNQKMSKSRGNVVNPDEMVERFGADTLRIYEMFMGPFDQEKPWDTNGMVGVRRFLERVWFIRLNKLTSEKADKAAAITKLTHKTIKKVGADIAEFRFNTAVSAMMILVNEMNALDAVPQSLYEKLVLILAPFAPHIAEELWSMLGKTTLVAQEKWPAYDEALTVDDEVTIPVQVNGKLRDTIVVPAGADKEAIETAAKASEKIQKFIGGKEIIRVVAVPGKMCNIVIKE